MATYPLPVFHFEVDWGGARIGFTEVSGLKLSTEVIEYREGINPAYRVQKQPGMQKFDNLTFKRGIFLDDNEFYDWWNEIRANTINGNTIARRDITVKLLNEDHDPVVVWNIESAWPVSVEGPGLNASNSEVAIETLEVAFENMTVANPAV